MAIRIDPYRHNIAKKSEESQRVLDLLDAYIEGNYEEPMKWLVRLWHDQAAALTYSELLHIVTDEDVPSKIFNDWFGDYSRLISSRITDLWRKTMIDAAKEHPAFIEYDMEFNTSDSFVRQWITDRTGNLITACLDEQRKAIRWIIGEAKNNQWGSAETARYIRPTIGLTEQQAAANQRFYTTFKENMRAEHPRMTDASIERRAREAAGRYAAKQQRTRAETIARTEMAAAYNEGNDQYVRQAMANHLMPRMVKVWSTAMDGHVCAGCQALEGAEVGMDEKFSVTTGKRIQRTVESSLPPMHPRCKCAVMYVEAEETSYDGIPKTWKDLETEEAKDDLTKVNPEHYEENCANCVIAYEMRMQGKAVYAADQIKSLRHDPWKGWIDPDVKEIQPGKNAQDEINRYLQELGEGSRIAIAGTWNRKGKAYSEFWDTGQREFGHVFVGELKDGTVRYIDVQHARMYNENILNNMNQKVIKFWQINGKIPSDLGATACKKER